MGLEGSRRNLKQRTERIEDRGTPERSEEGTGKRARASRNPEENLEENLVFKRRWETRGDNEVSEKQQCRFELQKISFSFTLFHSPLPYFSVPSSSFILLHSLRHYCTHVTRVLGKRVFSERNINYERFGAVVPFNRRLRADGLLPRHAIFVQDTLYDIYGRSPSAMKSWTWARW